MTVQSSRLVRRLGLGGDVRVVLRTIAVGVGLIIALLLAPSAGAAPTRPTTSPPVTTASQSVAPATDCAALAGLDFSSVETVVQTAVEENLGGHRYCSVTGYISPQTEFHVALPTSTWKGDYLQQGCAGLCGFVGLSVTDPGRATGQAPFAPLTNGELVVAADDQGHESPRNDDGLWARNDPALRVVYGYSSEHSLALTSKALIRAFYGRDATHRYFDGFSDGGHEALDLAQRYPDDFDGIIAGAPAANLSGIIGLFHAWLGRVNLDGADRQILHAEKLPALHAAVMRACANADGVITDPRSCTFQPQTLRCPAGTDTLTCLTPAEVRVVRAYYQGPTDRRGRNLFDGGMPYGSELAWQGWAVQPEADAAEINTTFGAALALNYLRHMAFWKNPPSDFGLRDVSFTVGTYQRLQQVGDIYDATNPDLRRFAAHGGKLIIYQGWADQAIPPFATLNYYKAVADYSGGFAQTQKFSRLYMVPGTYHCPCGQPSDGDPQSTVDMLAPLTRWVTDGQAPGTLTFPVTAQTTGSGLKSLSVTPFNPTLPAPKNNGLNSGYHYVGLASTYRPNGALWCRQDGPTLRCSRKPLR